MISTFFHPLILYLINLILFSIFIINKKKPEKIYLNVTNNSAMFLFHDMLWIEVFHSHDEEKQDLNHRNVYQDVIQMFD